MPRVRGNHRDRRTIPGLRTRLLAYAEKRDAAWGLCRTGDKRCGPCEFLGALVADEPVTVSGEILWRALFDERRPHDWADFMRDKTLWRLEPDTDDITLDEDESQLANSD